MITNFKDSCFWEKQGKTGDSFALYGYNINKLQAKFKKNGQEVIFFR